MAKRKSLEEKQKENAPFLAAFDYQARLMGLTQKELASGLGLGSGLISDYRAGKKSPSRETMDALIRVSGGRLNIYYMLGLSQHMLLADVPDDEVIRLHYGESSEKPASVPQLPTEQNPQEHSDKDEIISLLKGQLKMKDELIAAKDEIIDNLKAQIVKLESTIAKLKGEDLSDYFVIGVADDGTKPKRKRI